MTGLGNPPGHRKPHVRIRRVSYIGVSLNGGFSPQIIHFNRVSIINHPFWGAPWKINMEHTNHPFRKENDLPNP